MRIAILQLNMVVGDIDRNTQKIISSVSKLLNQNIDLFVTTELALLGYPPKDLLLRPSFLKKGELALKSLSKFTENSPPIIIGSVFPNAAQTGKHLFNVAAVLAKGKIIKMIKKTLIPSYDVFDEERYFESANED